MIFNQLRPGEYYIFQVWDREMRVHGRLQAVRGRVIALYEQYVVIEVERRYGTYRECVQRFDSDNFDVSKDPARFGGRPDRRVDLRALREKEGLSQEILASFLPGSESSREERLDYLIWCEKKPRTGIHEENYRKALGRARRFRQYTGEDYREMLSLHLSLEDMSEKMIPVSDPYRHGATQKNYVQDEERRKPRPTDLKDRIHHLKKFGNLRAHENVEEG